MDPISRFLTDNAHFISIVNGLSLFILGLSVALESSRKSTLKLGAHLKLLACYGFMAGLAHWVRLGMLTHVQPTPAGNTLVVEVLRLLCLVAAALFLLRFATKSIASTDQRYRAVLWVLPLLSAIYVLLVAAALAAPGALPDNWIPAADRYSRNLLLFPALSLAALAMWAEHRRFSRLEMSPVARDTRGAALAFGAKALASGLFAFPVFGAPGPLSATTVLALRIVRMAANAAVAFFMVRTLRFFEVERHRELERAVEQQLQAQHEVMVAQHEAHVEIERWAWQLEGLVSSIAAAMSKPAELEEVLDLALDKVLELTEFEAGRICLVQNGGQELQIVTQRGLPPSAQACRACLQPDEGVPGGSPSFQEIVVRPNLGDDPNLAGRPCQEAGFRLLVIVPANNRGNLLGTMHLLSRHALAPRAHELRLLSAIGQQIGVAIDNARLYEEVQSMAALEERERLGRELHDGLAQVLGYLTLKSKAVALLLSSGRSDQAQVELAEIQKVARETQMDVRESILGLRTTITPTSGLIPTITEYVHTFGRQSGIGAMVTIGDDVQIELAPVAEVQLLGIVQESLMNVRKHARASCAWVGFEVNERQAVVTIKDNGRGFDLSRTVLKGNGHFGLQTMKERAESAGGSFQIETEPGQGTRVIVRLPLNGGGGH